MSYSGLSGYGGYYNPSANNSDPQQGYTSSAGRQEQAPTSSYPDPAPYRTDVRPSQYPQDYSWGNQNQQSYGGNTEQSYGGDAWRAGTSQRISYDYQRQYQESSSSLPTAQPQGYSKPPNTTSKPASTHALNNLAYASGLESAGVINNGSSRSPYSTVPGPLSSLTSSQKSSASVARVQSPAQNTPQQSSKAQRLPSIDPTNTAHPRIANSAAIALAGAVSRRQQSIQKSASPAMGNASSYLPQPSQRSASPYEVQAAASQVRQRVQDVGDYNMVSPPQAVQKPLGARPPNAMQNPSSQSPQMQYQVSKTAAQFSSKIANLVSDEPISNLNEDLHQAQAEPTVMPNYIDPSQVFNPYHKEHERRKREAARAEADGKKKAGISTKHREPTAAASSKSLDTSAIPSQTIEASPAAVDEDTPATVTKLSAPSVLDDEVASEMKLMMERMKEIRSQDPNLFQQLWDDMRKGGSGASTKTAPTKTPQGATSQPRPPSKANTARASDHAQVDGRPSCLAPSNGYKIVVETSAEGLPDLDRFPAERRIRTSYKKTHSPGPGVGPAPTAVQQSTGQLELAPTGSTPAPNIQGGSASPLLVQALPPKTSTGTTIWPESKRAALAEAAVRALNGNKENLAVGITDTDVRAMLEENPSYLDLCKMLENKGLKFHRGQFARHLLSNVPDITGAQPRRQAPQNLSSGPPAATDGPPLPVHGFAPPMPNGPPMMVGPVQPTADGVILPKTVKGEFTQPLSSAPPSSVNLRAGSGVAGPLPNKPPKPRLGVPAPQIHTSTPGSKEAMARKRDFSELVDLTQLSDSEDYVMSSKKPRIESPSPEPDPFAAYEMRTKPAVSSGPYQSNAAPQVSGLSLLPSHIQPFKFNANEAPAGKPAAPNPPPASTQRTKAILAKPINKSEALRKSYYDPKTVARDILIAAGRHPSERPLNAHMAGLLGVHIDLDSDLSTFDWEAVDPGGPKAPKVEYVDIPAGPPRWKLGERGIQRWAHRDKRPPQLDTPAKLRQPPGDASAKSQPLAKPSSQLMSRFSEQTKQLLQDSLDTGRDRPSKHLRRRQSQVADEHEPPASVVTPSNRKTTPQLSVDITSAPHSVSNSLRATSIKTRETTSGDKMEGIPLSSAKRRGRPPGSKNKHPSLKTMKIQAQPEIEISTDLPTPKFAVFRCRWRNCNAQLHNLATLKAHLTRVHKPDTKTALEVRHICWWRKCEYLQLEADGGVRVTKAFENPPDWLEHIEKSHLHDLGVKHGDGPSTAHIDPQSIALDKARYLADQNQHTTTPTATATVGGEYIEDVLTLTNVNDDNHTHVGGYLKAHGKHKGKESVKRYAEETLRAMEVRKEKIGPGIDRGGCTLVNDARRPTLIQDADIARVVDYDY